MTAGRLAALALALFLARSLGAAESVYRNIARVSIGEQAKAAPGTSPKLCKKFRLWPATVTWLLRNAPEVDRRSYAHDLDYAPCSVEGKLELRNALTGTWEIETSGRARVVFDDEHVLLLHCRRCEAPFVH